MDEKIKLKDQDNNSGRVASYVAPLLYKIHNEDCRTTLAKLPDECIDLVVTSPPYDDLRAYKGYEFDFEVFTQIAKELFRTMKAGGVIVWVVNDATRNGSETLTSYKQALFFREGCGFNLHDTMIYKKKNYMPTNEQMKRYAQSFEYTFIISKGSPKVFNPIKEDCKYFGTGTSGKFRNKNGTLEGGGRKINEEKIIDNVWEYDVGNFRSTKDNEAFTHPATFPEKLAEDHIKTWSNENDIIYDPFSGSGTTCKVADRLGRAWLGSEIAEEYCSVALRRITSDLFNQAST